MGTANTLPSRGKIRIGGECPICGSNEFQDYRERQNEYCASCRAKARTRLTYLLLKKLDLLNPGAKVLHFAPEPGLRQRLHDVYGERYIVADYDQTKLEGFEAGAKEIVNLCSPPEHLTGGTFDLLLHSHVLEHLPCNWALAFMDIHRALKPTGIHVFSVPLSAQWSRDDINPDLPDDQRTALFGRPSHYRKFGRSDFRSEATKLSRLLGNHIIDAKKFIPREQQNNAHSRGNVFALVPPQSTYYPK